MYSTLIAQTRYVTSSTRPGSRSQKLQKRQSFSTAGDDQHGLQNSQPAQPTALAQTRDSAHNQQTDGAIGYHTPACYSLQDETRHSTLTYSSQNSGLPSICTTGSSPSVRPLRPEVEQLTPLHMEKPRAKKSKDRGEIFSSPTWKETDRKERRATKRLEAERKELEKRLFHLEESQARLEQGIYDRQSRRLTKKQPLDSGKRSSSVNSERPRSSRSLSAFFSGSRRSSRSRASSANANDRRRFSDNGDIGREGPPTLPLSLPDRFGTAVSRELASRPGTSLMSNSQPQHSLHHTAAKSDDLRENWKMAEAWQRQNSEREADDSLAKSRMEKGVNAGSGGVRPVSETFQKRDEQLVYSSTNSPLDLNRELFTASLRHEMKPLETQKPATPLSQRLGQITPVTGRVDSQGQSPTRPADALTTRVITALQLRNLPDGEDKQTTHIKPTSSGPIPKALKNSMAMSMVTKNAADTSSPTHQKEYKSSPLALNPVTTDDDDEKENKKPQRPSAAEYSTRELIPKPLRPNFEVARRRGRQSSYPSSSDMAQTRAKQSPRQDQRASLMGPVELSLSNVKQRMSNPISFDKSQPTALEVRSPQSVMPPMKHPGRKYALAENSPYGRLSQEISYIPTITTTDAIPVTRSQESVPHIRHSIAEMPASKSTPNVLAGHGRGHSRSSSGNSSYDTADEEVLDTPNHPKRRKDQISKPETRETNHSNLATTTLTLQDSPLTHKIKPTHPYPNPQTNSSPEPNSVVSPMRRIPMQKTNLLKKDQRIAKIFVICCHCQYWHDLPSELYAKLTYPERISSESRLVGTSSRGKPVGRRTSLKRAVLGGFSASVGRQDLVSGEMQVAGAGTGGNGEGQSEIDSIMTQSVPVSCCWCGHEMTRSCCQGWTTLVQMRERHH